MWLQVNRTVCRVCLLILNVFLKYHVRKNVIFQEHIQMTDERPKNI